MSETKQYAVRAVVEIDPLHVSTGKTKHYINGAPIPATRTLKIVSYARDSGFYLLHFDDNGDEIADTYHDSLDEAFRQATFEFTIEKLAWRIDE